MVCNVGKIDRIVRGLVALVMIASTLLFVPTRMPKILLLAASFLLFLSAWFGVCYFYRLLGLNTAKPKTALTL